MSVDAPDPLQRAVRALWPNLPMLLFGSILVTVPWALLRLLAGHLGLLVLVGLGVVVVPVFAGLLRGGDVLLTGDHFGVRRLFVSLGPSVLRAWRVTLPLTLVGVLTAIALRVWQLSGLSWTLGSVVVGCVVVGVGLLIATTALPYAVRTGAGLREVWHVSLYVATRNLVLVLGLAAACGLAVWASAYLSFALLILLPGPLALVWSAGAAMAIDRSRSRISVGVGRPPADRPL